jgi:hypothetical protein
MGLLRRICLSAVTVLALSATVQGCLPVPPGGVVIVRLGPPPPPYQRMGPAPGPGYVWVAGYWIWQPDEYVWVTGRWTRVPPGHHYWIPGRWVHSRRGWYFVEGRWD